MFLCHPGILGQYVISIPEEEFIVERLGHQRGKRSGKPFSNDFYVYIEKAYKLLNKGS